MPTAPSAANITATTPSTQCLSRFDAAYIQDSEGIPRCPCGGVIKPDIVFFGESVKYLTECERLCSRAELLFVLGSSLNVVPAAFLPRLCRGKIVVVNRGEVAADYLPPSRITLRVDADLDAFFRAVEAELATLR